MAAQNCVQYYSEPQTSFYNTYTPCFDASIGSYSTFNYLNYSENSYSYSSNSNLSNHSSYSTYSSCLSNQSNFPTSYSSNISADSANDVSNLDHQKSSIQISKVTHSGNTPKIPPSKGLFKRSILSPEHETSENIAVSEEIKEGNADVETIEASKKNEPVKEALETKRGRGRPKGSKNLNI